jgi:hypothetical protein
MTATMQAPSRAATTAPLDRLAREIKTEHAAAERAMSDSLAHAHRAGDLLLDVKDKLSHGQFLPWVREHCSIVPRTAQLYMQLARDWDTIAPNAQRVAHLSLRQAGQLLAGLHDGEHVVEADDLSVGRVARTYLDALRQFLGAIKRATDTPERLRKTTKVIQQLHAELHQEVQRLDQLLAEGEAAA